MGYLMEKNPQIKHQKLILLIFTIPIITYGTYTSYISVILGNYLWRYNFYLGIFVMAGFLFVTIKYGTLGVKINIEESNLNKTMKLISSGTSLLGHSIKNEVARINFSTYFLKQDLSYEDKKKYIEVIVNSTNHLNDLTARIQKNTNDIILVCELSSIRDIIEDSVNTMKLTIGERNIQIIEKYRVGPVIKIDKVHIAEVLNNIIQNAVESIPVNREGKIFIELYKSTKYAMIKINDNGTGISKENLPHVIKPFFSTKKLSTQNYGLGLSYCYNVMLAHKGFLEIKSQAAMGTSVYLSFLL
jgi:signal transduction histidine kinase